MRFSVFMEEALVWEWRGREKWKEGLRGEGWSYECVCYCQGQGGVQEMLARWSL